MAGKIKRKVFFYRIEAGLFERAPVVWDGAGDFAKLEGKDFKSSESGGRYLAQGDESVLLAIAGRTKPNKAIKVQFGRTRRTGLPRREKGGALIDLTLGDDEGLCEMTHALVYPKQRLVVAEYNFYAPRVTALPKYLSQVGILSATGLRFERIIRTDVLARVNAMSEIRLLDMTIRAPYAKRLAEANGLEALGEHMDALAQLGNAPVISLTLKRGRTRSEELNPKQVKKISKALLSQEDHDQGIERLVVRGISGVDGSLDTVDLLNDGLHVEVDFPRFENTRAVDTKRAWSILRDALTPTVRAELKSRSAIDIVE